MNKVQLNSKELKETFSYLILNNRELQEQNLKPVALSICGPAGLGKTSVIEQLAEELNIKHVEIINLAQLDELGDLVGIPISDGY
jgi:Holliday junction resolvasome RuvABC ATP-dependent DNA helicase subunit